VSFDNVKVGEYQAEGVIAALDPDRTNRLAYIGGSSVDANSTQLKQGTMKVLKPLLKSGKVSLELETFTTDCSAQNAYQDMKQFLDEGGQVDGVIAANDATASGVIQALHEHDLFSIPVSGQDAELGACQRVAQGFQTMTVYKPIDQLGRMAAEMAVQVARGLPVPVNALVNNGLYDIPSVLLESISVTRENLNDTVIRDGFHTHDDVFGAHP
jgi:ABC-type xylose transport system substrate-binding protein